MIIIHYYILNYMKLFQVMGSQSWIHHDLWWRLRKLLYHILMILWSYVTYVCFPTIKQYKTYSLNRFPIEKQHFTLAKWKKKTSAQQIHLDSRQLASLFPTSYKPPLIVEFPIVFPMNSHEIPWIPMNSLTGPAPLWSASLCRAPLHSRPRQRYGQKPKERHLLRLTRLGWCYNTDRK